MNESHGGQPPSAIRRDACLGGRSASSSRQITRYALAQTRSRMAREFSATAALSYQRPGAEHLLTRQALILLGATQCRPADDLPT